MTSSNIYRELFINRKNQKSNEKECIINNNVRRRIKSTIIKKREKVCDDISICHEKLIKDLVNTSDSIVFQDSMIKKNEKEFSQNSTNSKNKKENNNGPFFNSDLYLPSESTKIKKFFDFLFNW